MKANCMFVSEFPELAYWASGHSNECEMGEIAPDLCIPACFNHQLRASLSTEYETRSAKCSWCYAMQINEVVLYCISKMKNGYNGVQHPWWSRKFCFCFCLQIGRQFLPQFCYWNVLYILWIKEGQDTFLSHQQVQLFTLPYSYRGYFLWAPKKN